MLLLYLSLESSPCIFSFSLISNSASLQCCYCTFPFSLHLVYSLSLSPPTQPLYNVAIVPFPWVFTLYILFLSHLQLSLFTMLLLYLSLESSPCIFSFSLISNSASLQCCYCTFPFSLHLVYSLSLSSPTQPLYNVDIVPFPWVFTLYILFLSHLQLSLFTMLLLYLSLESSPCIFSFSLTSNSASLQCWYCTFPLSLHLVYSLSLSSPTQPLYNVAIVPFPWVFTLYILFLSHLQLSLFTMLLLYLSLESSPCIFSFSLTSNSASLQCWYCTFPLSLHLVYSLSLSPPTQPLYNVAIVPFPLVFTLYILFLSHLQLSLFTMLLLYLSL